MFILFNLGDTVGRNLPGVLRTADGVVNVRPKAMRGPRKAAGLLKLLIRSPPLCRRPATQTVAEKS